MEQTKYQMPTTELFYDSSLDTTKDYNLLFQVSIKDIWESEEFQNTHYELPIVIGQTLDKKNVIADLTQMPHLIVAGASAFSQRHALSNAIIASLLMKKNPSELKFILVDMRQVELCDYESIGKHFLTKLPEQNEFVVTDFNTTIRTLNSLHEELDQRYTLLREAQARTLKEYNKKFDEGKLDSCRFKRLPYIVVLIQEYTDLALQGGDKVESLIALLAQKSRTTGIHIILSTGRPRGSVITGIISACFPSRISFRCDPTGSKLLFHGDESACNLTDDGEMLINFGHNTTRVQSAWVGTEVIKRLVEHISRQDDSSEAYLLPDVEKNHALREEIHGSASDPLLPSVAELIVDNQDGSTPRVQRTFCIGYNRACRILDVLESVGIIGPHHGNSPRKVLVSNKDDLKSILDNLLSSATK